MAIGPLAAPLLYRLAFPQSGLTWRAALKSTVEDPAFLADSEKMGVSVDYMAPGMLQKKVEAILNTSPEVVSKVRSLIPANEVR